MVDGLLIRSEPIQHTEIILQLFESLDAFLDVTQHAVLSNCDGFAQNGIIVKTVLLVFLHLWVVIYLYSRLIIKCNLYTPRYLLQIFYYN